MVRRSPAHAPINPPVSRAGSGCRTSRSNSGTAPPLRSSDRPSAQVHKPAAAAAAEQRLYWNGRARSSWASRPRAAPASTSSPAMGSCACTRLASSRAALCWPYGCGDHSSATAGHAATAARKATWLGAVYCESAAAATPAPNGSPCRMSQTRSSSTACTSWRRQGRAAGLVMHRHARADGACTQAAPWPHPAHLHGRLPLRRRLLLPPRNQQVIEAPRCQAPLVHIAAAKISQDAGHSRSRRRQHVHRRIQWRRGRQADRRTPVCCTGAQLR